jgi:hypothetical protein
MAEKKRDYKKEYKQYHGKPEQIKRRSERNQARAKMEDAGKVSKGDGKDVDHKDHNTGNSKSSNLRVISQSKNRADNKKKPVRKK